MDKGGMEGEGRRETYRRATAIAATRDNGSSHAGNGGGSGGGGQTERTMRV